LSSRKAMKDLFNTSVFDFTDLSVAGKPVNSAFVSLFSSEAVNYEDSGQHVKAPAVSADDIARQAFEEAYAQGEKAGYEMGMRRAEGVVKRLEGYIKEVCSFQENMAAKHEHWLKELAIILAESIVLRDCEKHKEGLEGMIRKALEMCDDKGEIIIRVRTVDMPFVEEMTAHHLRVIADDAIKEPGFVIETSFGDIDGKISTQFEELRKALLGHHCE
jgi:flagellar biosynthesis/type III secretory pathway protein FliH